VVNQAFTRRYFSQGGALGRIVRIPRLRGTDSNPGPDFFEVVGVVKDSINRITEEEIAPEIFIPYTFLSRAERLFVQTQGPPSALAGAIRKQVYTVDREQPVMEVRPYDD